MVQRHNFHVIVCIGHLIMLAELSTYD